jgi:hypothetical protein
MWNFPTWEFKFMPRRQNCQSIDEYQLQWRPKMGTASGLACSARNDLHPHFPRSIVGPRETGFGISSRSGVLAGVATVQLNVVWQAAQSSEVTACWACLPVAVTPLWQLRQVALIPK